MCRIIIHYIVLFLVSFIIFLPQANAAHEEYAHKPGCGYNSMPGTGSAPANWDNCTRLPLATGSGSNCQETGFQAGISCSSWTSWNDGPVNIGYYNSKGETVCRFFCNNEPARYFVIASAPDPINGQCGLKDGATLDYGSINDKSLDLCSSGTVSDFQIINDSYSWKCKGADGGKDTDWCKSYVKCDYECSPWGECDNNGNQSRNCSAIIPSGMTQCKDTGNPHSTTQSCNICKDCGKWSKCEKGQQSCLEKSPPGCTGGNVKESRECGTKGECSESEIYGCKSGKASDKFNINSSYYWWCYSEDGGADSPRCQYTEKPINGSCNNSCQYCCSSGVLGKTYDRDPIFLWFCNGLNGGTDSGLCSYNNSVPCTACTAWSSCSNGVSRCTEKTPPNCLGGDVEEVKPCGSMGICDNSEIYGCSSGQPIEKKQEGDSYKWKCQSEDGGIMSPECNYTTSPSSPCASCNTWSACVDGFQSCIEKSPQDCVGNIPNQPCGSPGACNNGKIYGCASGNPIEKKQEGNIYQWKCQSEDGGFISNLCTYDATPICTDCSSWSACINGNQNCLVKSPLGCTGGNVTETKKCGSAGVCNRGEINGCISGYPINQANQGGTFYWYCASSDGGNTSSRCSYALTTPSLSCSSTSSSQIQCSWPASSGATTYQVERDGVKSTSSLVYIDKDLSCGTSYSYRIRSCIDNICSPWSSSKKVLTQACKPGNLTCLANSGTRINCNWQASSGSIGYYQLQRSSSAGYTDVQQSTSLTYSNNTHQCNTSYNYRVRACNNSGCSDWVEANNIKTNNCP